jgi:hypothetical protein
MWVPLDEISENFIETGGRWSSEHFFIGKTFSRSPHFLHPKKPEFSSSQLGGRHFVGDQGLSRGQMPSLARNRMTCCFSNIPWCATFGF